MAIDQHDSPDAERFEQVKRELFTAVIGDVLDHLGFQHQFLPPRMRPIRADDVLVGRAMPVLEADFFDNLDPFGRMFDALDDLKPGEIYFVAGGSPRYALFGELMSAAATARGARGAVLCGYHRDTRQLLQTTFPVFSYGAYAQDQGVRGRVIDYRVSIEVGSVRIEPGDLVVGDCDGVLVVPKCVEDEAIERALEKARIESQVKKAIKEGMLSRRAFDKFGVM